MKATVVIVDDHPTFRRLARRLLEEAGFAVVAEAGDGATAVRSVRTLRPTAVLLDVLLPDISGFEVAARLAADPDPPGIVLTSSRSRSELGVAVDEAPALGFIPKERLSGSTFARLLERA